MLCEYESTSLRQHLSLNESLQLGPACEIMTHVLKALKIAYSLKIHHKHLILDNIFIAQNGAQELEVTLADFQEANLTLKERKYLDETFETKLMYISPERTLRLLRQKQPQQPQSAPPPNNWAQEDMYSLGVCFLMICLPSLDNALVYRFRDATEGERLRAETRAKLESAFSPEIAKFVFSLLQDAENRISLQNALDALS